MVDKAWREHLGPMPVNVHIPTARLQQLVPITGSRKGGQDGENESETLLSANHSSVRENIRIILSV